MSKPFLILAACTVVAFSGLAGCIHTTPAQLRENHTLHSQFDVDDNLQAVIEKIDRKKNECGKPALPGIITLLEQSGEARIEYIEPSVNRVFLLVDLKRVNNKTRVDIYSKWQAFWEKEFRTLEYGAKGTQGCP